MLQGEKQTPKHNQVGFTPWPRKWKLGQKNKWLSELRYAIGYSQEKFAAMVGEPTLTVINIENGRRKLTWEIVMKIGSATGVSTESYLRGNDIPISLNGKPFTKEIFDHWRKNYTYADDESIEAFFQSASRSLRIVFMAAGRYKLKNKLPALRQSFIDWQRQAIAKFNLEKTIAEIQRENKSHVQSKDHGI